MEKNIKILIVGSKGYIGSSLYNYLEKKKYDIFGVNNHLYGRVQ
jgi:nucleoside-diphosphate-sugar epimerase